MTTTKKMRKALNRKERRLNKHLLSKLGTEYVPAPVPKDWNLQEAQLVKGFKKSGRKVRRAFNKNGRTMSVKNLLIEETPLDGWYYVY